MESQISKLNQWKIGMSVWKSLEYEIRMYHHGWCTSDYLTYLLSGLGWKSQVWISQWKHFAGKPGPNVKLIKWFGMKIPSFHSFFVFFFFLRIFFFYIIIVYVFGIKFFLFRYVANLSSIFFFFFIFSFFLVSR